MARRYYIVQGDSTTHGGYVIGGSDEDTIDDIPMARQGDEGYCPLCKRPFFIVEGLSDDTASNGRGFAVEGMAVSCGAFLMAVRQRRCYYEDDGEEGDVVAQNGLLNFDDYYIIRDAQTGKPVVNTEYTILRATGETEHGTTDANGKTHLLTSVVKQENITVYLEG